jgi:transposase-like protein
MNCPQCNSSNTVKSGKIKDKQRYKCRECGYNYYSVEIKSTAKPKPLKKLALHLYLEGLDFRSIGKILEVSNASVLKWIKEFGQKVEELIPEKQQIEMVEVDDMYSYVGSKKTVGHGLLLIDMEKGSSISLLSTEEKKQQKNFGKRKKNTK